MNLNPREKWIFLALVPLAAAGTGGITTYLLADRQPQQVVITPDAMRAAKDGKITVEVVTRDETHSPWPAVALPASILLGLGGFYFLMARGFKE
ncbi:MAG: hypothetical protein QOJ94_1150 [Sphingomonadales bacterium]|nr:hypothetical protein [Sphingomonadales bacterium]